MWGTGWAIATSMTLAQADHFLRDHKTGEVHHYDPSLFDFQTDLTVCCGAPHCRAACHRDHRSSWSNEFLHTHTNNVAKHSSHICKPKPSTSVCRVSSPP